MNRFFATLIVCAGLSTAACTSAASNGTTTAHADATASPAPTVAAVPASTPTAVAAGTPVAFTDIDGYDGNQAIKDLGALGVLDSTSGSFRPNDPITRSEFARWLVKAQNTLVEPEYRIRLAQGGSATFSDVPSSNPDYRYVQGLADAGFVVGIDGTHFAPAAPLTREQMIYVKAQVDERSDITTSGNAVDGLRGRFRDLGSIGQKYLGAIYEDSAATTTQTFSRVYGATKLFGPHEKVTRGEAAVALSVMKGEWNRSAAQALGRMPPP